MCLWHDVKLRKTQLEVRSLNVTWRRDLSDHRFYGNVSNCWLNSYGKFGGATRRRFFAICEKPEGGCDIRPPPGRARGIGNSARDHKPELKTGLSKTKLLPNGALGSIEIPRRVLTTGAGPTAAHYQDGPFQKEIVA